MHYTDPRKVLYSEIDIHPNDLKDLLMNEITPRRGGRRDYQYDCKVSLIVHN